jgi:HEAT repeat protein
MSSVKRPAANRRPIDVLRDENADVLERVRALMLVGKERRREILPVLRRILHSADPFLRAEALVVVVGIHADSESYDIAAKLLESDPADDVRISAADALGGLARAIPKLQPEIVGKLLSALLSDGNWRTQAACYRNLRQLLLPSSRDPQRSKPFEISSDVDWDMLLPELVERGLTRPDRG